LLFLSFFPCARTRLYLLLTLMGQTGVAEYSSTLPQRKRTQIIEKFAKGDIKMYVTSAHAHTARATHTHARTLTVAPWHHGTV
jgi:superfamily II DNA/RNA helicase